MLEFLLSCIVSELATFYNYSSFRYTTCACNHNSLLPMSKPTAHLESRSRWYISANSLITRIARLLPNQGISFIERIVQPDGPSQNLIKDPTYYQPSAPPTGLSASHYVPSHRSSDRNSRNSKLIISMIHLISITKSPSDCGLRS